MKKILFGIFGLLFLAFLFYVTVISFKNAEQPTYIDSLKQQVEIT